MPTTTPAPTPPGSLLDALLRGAPIDVLLFDPDLVCRYAAPADGSLFGRSAGELVGEPATAIFDPRHGDLHTALRLAADGPATYAYPSYRYADARSATKTLYCWSVRIEPVTLLDYRGHDEFRGVLVTLADVQDLSDERDRLLRDEARLLAESDTLRADIAALREDVAALRRERRGLQERVRALLAPLNGYLQIFARRPEVLLADTPETIIERDLLPRLRDIVDAVDDGAR